MYCSYGITVDSAGSWSNNNDTAKNIIIFGADNSLWSHADNCKNNILALGEGPNFGNKEHIKHSQVFNDKE